jgi:hypothetical protein
LKGAKGSVRTKELHNILTEFGTRMDLLVLIKCLYEIYTEVRTGKWFFSHGFHVQNAMKLGALQPFIFNFPVQEDKEPNGVHQLPVYADGVNLRGETTTS